MFKSVENLVEPRQPVAGKVRYLGANRIPPYDAAC